MQRMDPAKRTVFVERVVAAGRTVGISVTPHAMAETTATAAQAAAALGVQVGQIVKSLVFTVEGPRGVRGVLALVSGADRVDLVALAATLNLADGELVRRATADEARAFTGFVIGGIPPFGHASSALGASSTPGAPGAAGQALTLLADRGLAAWGELWAACGTHLDVFPISFADLLRASEAREVGISEQRT
jgi:prolyl-tRNA editing enzyme YbaK/EbsC (Cys-tRNA(Pro) deacylase)